MFVYLPAGLVTTCDLFVVLCWFSLSLQAPKGSFLPLWSKNLSVNNPQLHSDMDKGDGSIKYILTGEGAGTTFTIDDSTGDIHAIQRLDREVKAQYALRAQARNRLTDRPLEPESEFIVKIQDINDNEPKFLDGPYQASVPEMSKIGEPAGRWGQTETKLSPVYAWGVLFFKESGREQEQHA